MGQKDISLVRYFEDRERYADLINGFVFKGKQVVSEQDVQEMDSRITGVFGKLKKRFMIQKYEDSVRRIVFGMNFAVVGLENQDLVHYAMPVRIMLEDAAGYDKQLRQIRRHHRRRRDLRGDEFLSGFAIGDKVHPVVTICIYYGKTPYDGPKELYQMMEFKDLPDHLKEILNNYRIQVLEVRNFEDIDRFRTDLREVFGFIQRSGDKEAERRFTWENEEQLKALDEEAYDVITAVTGSVELEQAKERYREEGGKINMCEAIRGMIEDGRKEGVMEGLSKGLSEGLSKGLREGKIEGQKEGQIEGQRKKAYQTARNMYARGFSVEDTSALLEESPETVAEWFAGWKKEGVSGTGR